MGKCIVLGMLFCLLQAEQTGSIEGTVRMADGQPAACARLLLHCVTTELPYERHAWTGDDGHYVAEGLPAGTYTVDFVYGSPSPDQERNAKPRTDSSAVFEPTSLASAWQHLLQALAESHPHRVEVVAGATAKCDVQLPPVTAVTFRVYGDEGPIRDKKLELLKVDEHGWPAHQPEFGEKILTNPRGEAHFPMLPEGRYVPLVGIGRWGLQCGVHEVRGENTEPIPVRLGSCRVAVRILDTRGEPIPEVKLKLESVPDGMGVRCYAARGVDGHFRIPYVRKGTYDFEVELGTVTSRVSGIRVDPRSPSPEIEVLLTPMGSVRVLTVDPQGRPCEATAERFEVIGRRATDGKLALGQTRRWSNGPMTPTERSEVRFENLTEGTWRFGVLDHSSSSGFRGEPLEVEVKAYEVTEVTLVVED